MSKTDVIERESLKPQTEETEVPVRINGSFDRVIKVGQLVFMGAILPWGVWVTGQIYGLNAGQGQLEQWKNTREKAAVATLTDVELAKLKVKDELMVTVSAKIDTLTATVNEIDKRLREHDALTRAKP